MFATFSRKLRKGAIVAVMMLANCRCVQGAETFGTVQKTVNEKIGTFTVVVVKNVHDSLFF